MSDIKKESNGREYVSVCKNEHMLPKGDALKINGSYPGIGTDCSGRRDRDCMITYKRKRNAQVNEDGIVWHNSQSYSGTTDCDCLFTYKRRRNAKVIEGGIVSNNSPSYLSQKMKQFLDQSSCTQKQALINPSNNYSLKQHRNIVLEQIFQSMEDKDCLKQIIQNAIVSYPGTDKESIAKVSANICEGRNKHTLQPGTTCNTLANEAECLSFNQSVSELNYSTVTELFRSTIFDIIMSEKFAQLCSLLLKNFQGIRTENLLDLRHINSRMKDKAYESSPLLFHSDVQQVWTKLQKVGIDIITLAKALSEKTRTSFQEWVGSSAHSVFKDVDFGVLNQESHMQTKLAQTEACALVQTCSRCGETADGRSGLVCDSCEEMYHISCIEPAVKEIPLRSWYCANCTLKGIESPHDDCIACKRLNAIRLPSDGNEEDGLMRGENLEGLEESSHELVVNEGFKRIKHCTTCKAKIKKTEDYRTCGHFLCVYKFYHVKCLTSKELISHGRRWYCPSCLCRACFTDRDDDQIVLCDGCDCAYHTYCMQPPRSTIPTGKWFCQQCSAGIQHIHEAKRLYESIQSKSTKRILNGKLKEEEASQKSGGVDMLLNAAITLNHVENLAARRSKTTRK